MTNPNYQRGVRFERERKKAWKESGHTVLRTAGSHGAFDLVAIPLQLKWPVSLIQCKVLKTGTSAQACAMVKAFKKNPPLLPSAHYHQVLEVYCMKGRHFIEGTI